MKQQSVGIIELSSIAAGFLVANVVVPLRRARRRAARAVLVS
jgi:hypothetical protein